MNCLLFKYLRSQTTKNTHKFADWSCSVSDVCVHRCGRLSSCTMCEQRHSLFNSVPQAGRWLVRGGQFNSERQWRRCLCFFLTEGYSNIKMLIFTKVLLLPNSNNGEQKISLFDPNPFSNFPQKEIHEHRGMDICL